MGNRLSSKRDIKVLILGIDGAGKTTLLQNLANEHTEENQIPSKGFCSRRLTKNRFNILLMDVGGGSDIRGIWPKYFAESHAIIYVVDTTNASRLEESKVELEKVLLDDRVACKPLLVLCNKADLRNPGKRNDTTMGVWDVIEGLDLQNLLRDSGRKCEGTIQPKARIWLCSALKKKTRNHQDRKIKRATKWLLKTISNHWTTLAPRVESQFGVEEAQRQKAKAERIERRRMRQEEEDRLEALAEVETASKSDNDKHTNSEPQSAPLQIKPSLTITVEAEIEETLTEKVNEIQPTKPVLVESTEIMKPDYISAETIPKLLSSGRIILPPVIQKSHSCEPLNSSVNEESTDLSAINTPPLMKKGQLPPLKFEQDKKQVSSNNGMHLLASKESLSASMPSGLNKELPTLQSPLFQNGTGIPIGNIAPSESTPIGADTPKNETPIDVYIPVKSTPTGADVSVKSTSTGDDLPVKSTPIGSDPPVKSTPTGADPPVKSTPTGAVPPIKSTPTGTDPPVKSTPTGADPPVKSTSVTVDINSQAKSTLIGTIAPTKDTTDALAQIITPVGTGPSDQVESTSVESRKIVNGRIKPLVQAQNFPADTGDPSQAKITQVGAATSLVEDKNKDKKNKETTKKTKTGSFMKRIKNRNKTYPINNDIILSSKTSHIEISPKRHSIPWILEDATQEDEMEQISPLEDAVTKQETEANPIETDESHVPISKSVSRENTNSAFYGSKDSRTK